MGEFKVYMPAHGETLQDAYVIDALSGEQAAEKAFELYWSNHDGWEWLRSIQVFRVIWPDGEEADVEISVEGEPVFSASIRPRPRTATGTEQQGVVGCDADEPRS